jgi:hypothetical protein
MDRLTKNIFQILCRLSGWNSELPQAFRFDHSLESYTAPFLAQFDRAFATVPLPIAWPVEGA